MMVADSTWKIWNRACFADGSPPSTLGDQALSAMILAHSLAMNGGVFHAVEQLNNTQWTDALNGYSFFGFDKTIDLLRRAKELLKQEKDLGEHERDIDHEYAQYIPDDMALVHRFEQHLAAHPEHFAPL